jgi:hypothetical protein
LIILKPEKTQALAKLHASSEYFSPILKTSSLIMAAEYGGQVLG